MMLPTRPAVRTRIATQFAAFGLAAMAVAVFSIYLVIRQQEERLAYLSAEQRADDLIAAVQAGRSQMPLYGYIEPHAALVPSPPQPVPDPLRRLAPGHHLIEGKGEIEHVVVREQDGTRVYAIYGDRAHGERVARFGRILLAILVMLGAAVMVFAAWWAKVIAIGRPVLHRRLARLPVDAAATTITPADGNAAYLSAAPGSQQREREFIANVGHELRTPITLVLTGCELLMESEQLGERDKTQLLRIVNAAEHMNETLRSFMILARDGDLGMAEPVELRQCLLDVLAPHRTELQQRGLQLQLSIGAEAVVEANREAVFVVVSNLVRNAIKYTDRGGISVHYLGNTLHIADTGSGIGEADLASIFLPFYRTRGAAESGRAGLGLGLTIVKRICDFYGWSIQVRSKSGQGTTVSIEFLTAVSLFR